MEYNASLDEEFGAVCSPNLVQRCLLVRPEELRTITFDLAAGRLVAPFGCVSNGLSMYVMYPKARATDPQLIAFRDWLLETGHTRRQ
jgi:DNA-binding transcriptional LysR family regulator